MARVKENYRLKLEVKATSVIGFLVQLVYSLLDKI